MNDTVLIAGAYGTGKSTLCLKLTERLNIPSFSAGDLISDINGERYGSSKVVIDKSKNQLLLVEQLKKLNAEFEKIILAGHFCIFNKSNQVELLPESVFAKLNISLIILLEAKTEQIREHLKKRDGKAYSESSISELVLRERIQALKISSELNCPFAIYQMTFSDIDAKCISEFIQGG